MMLVDFNRDGGTKSQRQAGVSRLEAALGKIDLETYVPIKECAPARVVLGASLYGLDVYGHDADSDMLTIEAFGDAHVSVTTSPPIYYLSMLVKMSETGMGR